MKFYDERILPILIDKACSVGPVMKLRSQVVPQCEGVVLVAGASCTVEVASVSLDQDPPPEGYFQFDMEFDGWARNVARLGEMTGEDTSRYSGYLAALRRREQAGPFRIAGVRSQPDRWRAAGGRLPVPRM